MGSAVAAKQVNTTVDLLSKFYQNYSWAK